MQYHWLNKQNNDKLIIFFGGWSFDYKPFEFLECKNFDVLMFYDYNTIEMPLKIDRYKETYLIAWSMGVFSAYLLKDELPIFTHKIAVNGTPYPVNNEWGIPEKPFLLTLRHAKTGLEGKFYQNIFNSREEFERYMSSPVERPIDNREKELKSLYNIIKNFDINYEKFYDTALISKNDKIIPSKNQASFWLGCGTPYQMLESGHFPYYNYKSWEKILCR